MRSSESERRVQRLFQEEERRGLIVSAWLRFAVVFVFLATSFFGEDFDIWLREEIAEDLPFAAVGVLQLLLARLRIGWRWPKYVFAVADAALLGFVLFGPDAVDFAEAPVALLSREPVVVYAFIFCLFAALTYSPALMVWYAVCFFMMMLAALLWILGQPGTVSVFTMPDGLSPMDQVMFSLQPNYVDVESWFEELLVWLIVSCSLAVAIRQSRKIAMRAASLQRERGNLARYFSPNVIGELAARDEPQDRGRRVEIAVLFADIVDFTAITEDMQPEQVLDLLRDFHGRMEAQVFAYGGTLEKYIGDALMTTFGVSTKSGYDAATALCCARALSHSLQDWNRERAAAGLPAIRAGIGLHYGPAVAGDIGSEHNMAYAVIGSTVNMTSRLEGLTRPLGAEIVMSQMFCDTVRSELGIAGEPLLAGFADAGAHRLKGFDQPVRVRAVPAPGQNMSGS